MYTRTRMWAASDYSPKNSGDKRIAEDVVKQAEIRKITRRPIRDEETMKRLCAYLLFDTENIVVVELDKKRKVQRILSVPLCTYYAQRSDWYVSSIVGKNRFAYRAIAMHINDTTRKAMLEYTDIIEHFWERTTLENTVYYLCHGFDVYRKDYVPYQPFDFTPYLAEIEEALRRQQEQKRSEEASTDRND